MRPNASGLDRLKDLQEHRGFEVILYFDEDLFWSRRSTPTMQTSIVPVQARRSCRLRSSSG